MSGAVMVRGAPNQKSTAHPLPGARVESGGIREAILLRQPSSAGEDTPSTSHCDKMQSGGAAPPRMGQSEELRVESIA